NPGDVTESHKPTLKHPAENRCPALCRPERWMGLGPTQDDEKRVIPATAFYGTVTLFPCHPDRSEPGFPASLHWTRPRVHLSLKERRMVFDNATNFYRKFGGAGRRD